MRYSVQRGLVEVQAHSSIHDTHTRFAKLGGHIDFDVDAPAGATAEVTVDMRVFDAGDRLKNWKLRSDLQPDQHPTATFTLSRLTEVHEELAGRFVASAVGQLRWRGRAVDLQVKGQAAVDRGSIEASARFALDVRQLGITPPRFLMVKVEDIVTVQVTLRAIAVPVSR